MLDLSNTTDSELKEELKKREQIRKKNPKPRVLHNARVHIQGHFDKIIDMAEGVIDEINEGRYHEDNDDAQYMYETAMKCVYGEHIFEWIQSRTSL